MNDPILNKANVEFKKGPNLIIARKQHACAKMEINGEIFIVVAGGITNSDIGGDGERLGSRSVEFLNKKCFRSKVPPSTAEGRPL